ncbi:hypothetical protein [Fodinibius salsisoli]|uniref:Uncharacterized protein n=1 Tax=Fodinibius salsisoli TaxID=2820877 RepID=A0ABT3PQB3_9BACT|nr:hypothetical protein [Fodinibius salsisoli]MCW9708052.1 hypothetical protein [Fodinibius salsisoli]
MLQTFIICYASLDPNFLSGEADLKIVRGSTKEEAVAFTIASILQSQPHQAESLKSRTLILEDKNSFRGLKKNNGNLILITNFEESKIVYSAVSNGHHVIIPAGPDDSFNNQNIIDLPLIDRDGQVNALVDMGIPKDESKRLSRESGRNITILKKQLGFPLSKHKWAHQDEANELIPALLVGRWDESKEGDREILEKISGEDYKEYSGRLMKWLKVEAPPLMKIGSTWRLTSPLDAWTNLSNLITDEDLNKIRTLFLEVFEEIDPVFELAPEERKMASIKGKESIYSSWCREGLIQSIILIALYGESLKVRNNINPQEWADSIIDDLLLDAPGKLWASRNQEMPLIAEASPDSFIKAVKESLSKQKKPIMTMFTEEEGVLSPTSRHTGLLWALECLAWDPKYLYQSSSLLAQLAKLDPGGNLTNRPINSLTEIYLPWHYQTFASFEERMETIEEIIKNEYEIGWTLLINLFPNIRGIAHPTYKMRWRLFDKSYDMSYSRQEIHDTYSYITKLALKYLDYSETKVATIIDKSTSLGVIPKDRKAILNTIESNLSEINQEDFSVWYKLREILSKHRTHSDAKWALSENILDSYEQLYIKLEPQDPVQKYLWLFDEHWPDLVEGKKKIGDSYEKLEEEINTKRVDALRSIYQEVGIDGVILLSDRVGEPWIFGSTLAELITEKKEIKSIIDLLKLGENHIEFIHGFVNKKSNELGYDWIFKLYEKLAEEDFQDVHLVHLFIPLSQNRKVWKFIENTSEELEIEYWNTIRPAFSNLPIEERLIGINKLIMVGRHLSAIKIASINTDDFPSDKLVKLLEQGATSKSEEDIHFQGYEINNLFEVLDEREDVDESTFVHLEWLYLQVLTSYGSIRKPKLLHKELAKNPKFFVDVLSWIYKSDKEDKDKSLSEEQLKKRAEYTYDLLSTWNRIPGTDESNNLNYEFLRDWIEESRKIANERGYLEIADLQIGKVLAEYPENIEPWPPEEICKVIDTINTESMKDGFSTATFNKRGSSTRGPFEGGDIEREHSNFFQNQADSLKNKYPNTAEILERLARNYEQDAKRMDEMAQRDKLDY